MSVDNGSKNNRFRISKREKRGLIVFLCYLVVLGIVPDEIVRYFKHETFPDWVEDSLSVFRSQMQEPTLQLKVETPNYELVDFDPNHASEDELSLLGIPDYLSRRIVKYRNKGGKFFKPQDLQKIYGMSDSLFQVLRPFIVIPKNEIQISSDFGKRDEKPFEVKIDLNRVDTNDLKSIHGIGSVYARRILAYRDILGGFHKVDQLQEVYGIQDSLLQAIRYRLEIGDQELQQIRINQVDVDELRKHPYFRNYNLARSIVRYRDQHGAFDSANALQNIHLMSDSLLNKIRPYISFQ